MSLTRKDWDDISKLTLKNISYCQIIEVKVIESFIGVKPYPVIVVIKTVANKIFGRQYTLEGMPEKLDGDFQIVKLPELQEHRYLKPLLFIMAHSLPIAKGPDDTFLRTDLSAWSLITSVNQHHSLFTVQGTKFDFSEIETFDVTINNQQLNFNDFINYLPKVNIELNT